MKRAEKHELHTLTAEQKAFCEENHNLVYSFLHKHGYKVEEFYNIVILSYVRACQMYLEREDLNGKIDFPVVAHMNMKQAISNHFKTENRQCRKCESGTISYEQMIADIDEGGNGKEIAMNEQDVLEKIIQTEKDIAYMENLLAELSELQRGIMLALLEGYKEREIYKRFSIGRKAYKEELENIKVIIRNI